MRQKIRNLALLFLIFSLFSYSASASFSDVTDFNPNADAINYLKQEGIIDGYNDGTFKPYRNVNRAEFLKIIIEGSNISTETTDLTPFSDIDYNTWYAPYIKKAYNEGWVVGYDDGTFRPEQTINKVEALKILGKVQDWPLPTNLSKQPFLDTPADEWYTPYVYYAKKNNYLEETSSIFNPADLMTRGKISEIIYRTLTIEPVYSPNNETPPDSSSTSDDETETISREIEEPAYKTISRSFFDDIELDDSLPNTFYEKEVYQITGTITSGNYSYVTALLDPENSNPNDYLLFTNKTNNSDFTLYVYFAEAGSYNLGILPGENGETKTASIVVASTIPSSSETLEAPPEINSHQINYDNNTTSVSFNNTESTIKKLILSQGTNSVTYYSRQDIEEIPLNYRDFRKFNKGQVSYQVKSAYISSEKPLSIESDFSSAASKTFNATEHTFSEIFPESISANPPDLISSSEDISFTGTVKTESQKNAYIIKPDGFTEETELSTTSSTSTYFGFTTIPQNADFGFNYNPDTNGRYIVEIVDKNGLPTLNHPVYVGSSIPLIPDYFDLNERIFFSGTVDLSNARNELLSYINQSRADHGLSPITLSSELNNLAQDHSRDMKERTFFSHINPDGDSPEDRRLNAGIKTQVSENIARDVSIAFSHWGLMRSATHRSNILNENWTQVGLGIVEDNGYLIITEEFSTSGVTSEDLDNFKTELFTEINDLRNSYSSSPLSYMTNLENVSTYLNDQAIDYGNNLSNTLFLNALEDYDVIGTSQAIGRTYTIWSDILDSILEDELTVLSNNVWKNIGIDIQLDETGTIYTTFVINHP